MYRVLGTALIVEALLALGFAAVQWTYPKLLEKTSSEIAFADRMSESLPAFVFAAILVIAGILLKR